MPPTTGNKPKILCLHGGGSNPDIHHFQARKLHLLLDRAGYDLVVPRGLVPCGPGPGMLPFFEGAEFAQWLWDGRARDGGNEAWNDDHQVEQDEWADLPRFVDNVYRQAPGPPFIGVVAFSQGAKVAVHLARWLQENQASDDEGLKFLVLVCSTSPFRGKRQPGEPGVPPAESITIPSFHVIAEKDEWHNQAEIMAKCFKDPVVVRSQEGHHMPMDNGLNRKIADFINEKSAA